MLANTVMTLFAFAVLCGPAGPNTSGLDPAGTAGNRPGLTQSADAGSTKKAAAKKPNKTPKNAADAGSANKAKKKKKTSKPDDPDQPSAEELEQLRSLGYVE